MKVTLRKAAALQKLINDQIKSLELPMATAISVYSNPTESLAAARATFFDRRDRSIALILALHDIREKLAVRNVEVGVSQLLTRMASIERRFTILSTLGRATNVSPSSDELTQRFEAAKNGPQDRFTTRQDTFGVGVITAGEIQGFAIQADELRKQKQNLSDELLNLNVSHDIELSDDTEATLRNNRII